MDQLLERKGRRMIYDMKRAAGLVTLLGLAFSTAVRPALAQDGASNSWFDSAAPEDAPPPPDSAPEAPETGAPDPASPQGPSGPPPTQAPQQEPQQSPQQVSPTDVPETDPRAMTEFRPTLDLYGTWVDDQKFGTVWVPNRDTVGDDFAPYVSAGHWALTDDNDWTWQSDYPFGAVVFHYGRWVWIPGTGWAWVAGQRYANAWVTWRVPTDDYGYVGWAPMPPAWGWYGGAALSLGWYPPTAYVFCPSGYAFSPHVHSYIVHDRYVIHDVAAHTRNYSDAGRGGTQHVAASPRVLPANSAAPRGPSLQAAHVPPSMAPASRLPTRSAFAGPHSAGAPSFRSTSGFARSQSAYQSTQNWSPSSTGYRSSSYANRGIPGRPAYSSPSASGYRAAPRVWSAPSAPRAYSAAPSEARSQPAFHYSAPAQYAAPARYSAPVHYSAPAVHYSAPAIHYSAPAFRSPPAFHSAPSNSFHSPSRR